MIIRAYNPETDYPAIEALYRSGKTFGGQFDEARDTKERLDALESAKPNSILVAEYEGRVVASVTLFEDGRSAWLYRFAVSREHEETAAPALWAAAKAEMAQRGHEQVLVYAPAEDAHFLQRYTQLGFTQGNDFTCYWQDL